MANTHCSSRPVSYSGASGKTKALCGVGILVLTLAVSSYGLASAEQTSGHQNIREMAEHYEVVQINTRDHTTHVRRRRAAAAAADSESSPKRFSHPTSTSFDLSAFGKDFRLNLELNTVLIPERFEVHTFTPEGDVIRDRDVEHCYYHGQVDGLNVDVSNTHAVLSTCDGLTGSFGLGPVGHWTEDDSYFIRPLSKGPDSDGLHPHAVFKARHATWRKERGKHECGVKLNESIGHLPADKDIDGTSAPRLHRYQDNATVHSRQRRQSSTIYNEVVLIMDFALYQRLNGDRTVMANRARSAANFIDGVYRQLNIRVALVGVQIFNTGNQFTITSAPSPTLSNLHRYRAQQLNPTISNDNAQLMSGLNFDGTTIGLASVSGMCTTTASGGVNQDTSTDFTNVASTITHEMGHNFGMGHDTSDRGCSCPAPNGPQACVMAPSKSSLSQNYWSTCSTRDLSTYLASGRATCLSNAPMQLFGTPVCGNGFREGTEQCDCGTAAQCTAAGDTCCNPTTCRLTTGSQCTNSDGPCCQNCRYRPAGAVCRTAVDSCDVAETCSGLTHTCPNNLYVQNGQRCTKSGSSAFCYEGACETHDSQCKRTWGSTASVAPQSCYNYNTQGTASGNCGINTVASTYTRCMTDNVYCGRLQCIGGERFNVLFQASTTRTVTIGSITCKSTDAGSGSDQAGLSLVDNGVMCDTNSLCFNQQCRRISSLGITPCPSVGGRVCSGNGVCTNLNSCLCNKGWSGTDCSRATNGGPVNGQWSPWSTFSGCSQTCGTTGTRVRMRSCDNPPPSNGGASCAGASTQSEGCNRVVCATPVNGAWSLWGSWSTCSKSCASGSRFRFRTCTNPAPADGGSNCPAGGTIGTQTCNTAACPSWSAWGPYSSCTVTCGGGKSTRTRTCQNNAQGSCTGTSSQTIDCNVEQCGPGPIDGGWSMWTQWGQCSRSCGVGTQSRARVCNNPSPANGGQPCSSSGRLERGTQSCNVSSCSLWSPWGPFAPCSASCGGGMRVRMRTCPVANLCSGSATETELCNTIMCDIRTNGNWADWTAWEMVGDCYGCTAGNFWQRKRTCSLPPPNNGGLQCPGSADETRPCVCVDGKFSPWSTWTGNCGAEGTARQTRDRTCTKPAPSNGGAKCEGSTTSQRSCSKFTPWSTWSDTGNCSLCTNESLTHIQRRSRECTTLPDTPCVGDIVQSRACPLCILVTAQPPTGGEPSKSSLSGGTIAGIIIALLIVIAVVVVVVIFYVHKSNAKKPMTTTAHARTASYATRPSAPPLQGHYVLASDNGGKVESSSADKAAPSPPARPKEALRPPPRPFTSKSSKSGSMENLLGGQSPEPTHANMVSCPAPARPAPSRPAPSRPAPPTPKQPLMFGGPSEPVALQSPPPGYASEQSQASKPFKLPKPLKPAGSVASDGAAITGYTPPTHPVVQPKPPAKPKPKPKAAGGASPPVPAKQPMMPPKPAMKPPAGRRLPQS